MTARHYEDSNPPIEIKKNARLIVPISIIGSVLLLSFTVGIGWANYTSTRDATTQTISKQDVRIGNLESAQSQTAGDIREINANIRAINENLRFLRENQQKVAHESTK